MKRTVKTDNVYTSPQMLDASHGEHVVLTTEFTLPQASQRSCRCEAISMRHR